MTVILGTCKPYAFLVAMVKVVIVALDLFRDKLFVNLFNVTFWILYISVKLMSGFLGLPVQDT